MELGAFSVSLAVKDIGSSYRRRQMDFSFENDAADRRPSTRTTASRS